MDLFLKLSVLQANVCWLGEVEEIICRLKENVAGKKIIEGGVSEGICIRNLAPLPPPPPFPTEGLKFEIWSLGHSQTGQ